MKILFASNNQGKLKEARAILGEQEIKIISPNEIFETQYDVPETGSTFIENAHLKAKFFGDHSNLITIADDSGLAIDALNGKPGILSARFAPTDQERINKVLKLMIDIKNPHRTAKFVCAITVYNPQTGKFWDFEAESVGSITKQPQGTDGFGYDPIFYSNSLQKTFAQAGIKEKNLVSHRKQALQKAKPLILQLIKQKNLKISV